MMKLTIDNPDIITDVCGKLRAADMTWLDLRPHVDYIVSKHLFAVYCATIRENRGEIYNAWIVVGGRNTNNDHFTALYNVETYTTHQEALAAHIGSIVIEGDLTLIEYVE